MCSNLRFSVDQKPNRLKLLGVQPPRPPASEIHYQLTPFPTFMYLSQKHVLNKTSSYTDIIVKRLTGITDKFERKELCTLKSMQNKFTKILYSCRSLILKSCPGPQKSSWQPCPRLSEMILYLEIFKTSNAQLLNM